MSRVLLNINSAGPNQRHHDVMIELGKWRIAANLLANSNFSLELGGRVTASTWVFFLVFHCCFCFQCYAHNASSWRKSFRSDELKLANDHFYFVAVDGGIAGR